MKRMLTKNLLTTLAASALLAGYSADAATIVASWDAWADTDGTGGYAADSTLAGITADVSDSENLIGGTNTNSINNGAAPAGSIDGTFGPTVPGASIVAQSLQFNNERGATVTNGEVFFYVNFTNGTGGSLTLDKFLFDYNDDRAWDTFSIDFENLTTPASSVSDLGSGFASGRVWTDFGFDVSAVTLAAGESGRFVMTWSRADGGDRASSYIDNLAITLVPEPGSLALLGLGGLLIAHRRRRD